MMTKTEENKLREEIGRRTERRDAAAGNQSKPPVKLEALRNRRSVDTGPEFNQSPEPNEIQLLSLIAEKVPGFVMLAPEKNARQWRVAAGKLIPFNVAAESPGDAIRKAAEYLGLKLPTPVGGCGLPNTPKPQVAAL